MKFGKHYTQNNPPPTRSSRDALALQLRHRLHDEQYHRRLRFLYRDTILTQVEILEVLNGEFEGWSIGLSQLKKDLRALRLRRNKCSSKCHNHRMSLVNSHPRDLCLTSFKAKSREEATFLNTYEPRGNAAQMGINPNFDSPITNSRPTESTVDGMLARAPDERATSNSGCLWTNPPLEIHNKSDNCFNNNLQSKDMDPQASRGHTPWLDPGQDDGTLDFIYSLFPELKPTSLCIAS